MRRIRAAASANVTRPDGGIGGRFLGGRAQRRGRGFVF